MPVSSSNMLEERSDEVLSATGVDRDGADVRRVVRRRAPVRDCRVVGGGVVDSLAHAAPTSPSASTATSSRGVGRIEGAPVIKC